jgi:hypothetical protein
VIGATTRALLDNQTATWQPVAWRSGRMKRVIVSTLASEAQAFLLGIRELEWVLAQVMEILAGLRDFSHREQACKVIPSAGVTDAKSLYDSLVQPTSANIQDREAGLDVIRFWRGRGRPRDGLRARSTWPTCSPRTSGVPRTCSAPASVPPPTHWPRRRRCCSSGLRSASAGNRSPTSPRRRSRASSTPPASCE